ncbi:hypothetical protein [Streptomyces sp. Tu 2975]|uniref:hypothetical protein n=1 Tax=Streptomyces sp. Tu 2975 TaxID=2676871 RepID=UPI001FC9DA8C|nr:hypothetical protein [Streptomyces sp. Tu 2975]
MRAARIEDGAVIGDECLVGEESIVQGNVRVYPFKTVEAGAFVNTSVIWESRGQAHLFGARGVSGILNVEITPEVVVRLAGAYATTLKKGATVTTARDHSRGARALKRAVISALQASAIDVRDLENVPLPVARQQTARGSAGGIMIRTSPGVPDSVDIMFFDERGRTCRRAGSGSWTGCTRVRSTGVRSRARSAISTFRRASSTRTPAPCCGTWTPPGSPSRASRSSSTRPTAAPVLCCRACWDASESTH